MKKKITDERLKSNAQQNYDEKLNCLLKKRRDKKKRHIKRLAKYRVDNLLLYLFQMYTSQWKTFFNCGNLVLKLSDILNLPLSNIFLLLNKYGSSITYLDKPR